MTKAVPGSTSGVLWRSETFNRQRLTFRFKVGVSVRGWRDTTEPWNQVENTFLQVGEGKKNKKTKAGKCYRPDLNAFILEFVQVSFCKWQHITSIHRSPCVCTHTHFNNASPPSTAETASASPPPPPGVGGNQGQLTSLAAGEDTAPSVAMARPDSSSSKAPTSAVFVL